MKKRHRRPPQPTSRPADPLALSPLALFDALRERAARDATGLVPVEGVRQLLTAYQAGKTFHAIVHAPILQRNGDARRAIKALRAAGVPVQAVSPEAFRRVSTARHASGVGAIVRQKWTSPERLSGSPGPGSPGGPELWIGARHLRSDGNLGTILRTIDATRAAGLICLGATLDPFAPDVVRASMGAIMSVGLMRTTHSELGRVTRGGPTRVLGASAHGERALWECDLSTRPTVVLIGHERHGLTEEEAELCDELVTIPMQGAVSSINAGVAASLVLYEAMRQRAQPSPATVSGPMTSIM